MVSQGIHYLANILRCRLPLQMRFRVAWARVQRKPAYLWMPYQEVVRQIIGGRFERILGYPLDLERPQTFNEKIQWRKVYDRRTILPVLVDKYRVRDYVRERVGAEYLIPLLYVGKKPRRIPFKTLEPPYIIKPNNGSGTVFIVRDVATLDTTAVISELDRCMRDVYLPGDLEWAYSKVPPRVLVERLLLERDGQLPRDYKFHVFHGRVAYLHVDQDRERRMRSVTYDADWRPVNLEEKGVPLGDPAPPPPNAADMIALAETLAADLDYARVDLYNLDGRIYFGEITIYPAGGWQPFVAPEWDWHWGALWTLPQNGAPAQVHAGSQSSGTPVPEWTKPTEDSKS